MENFLIILIDKKTNWDYSRATLYSESDFILKKEFLIDQ